MATPGTAAQSGGGSGGAALAAADPAGQMATYRSYVALLADMNAKDENKLKAAQEISDNFEFIVNHAAFPQFLDLFVKTCLKLLLEDSPCFIAEYNVQQLRKLVLDMLHRTPAVDALRQYTRSIINAMFKLLEIDNEENVLVCLRIIIEMHKQFRPAHTPEIQQFLTFVKSIYKELPNHLNKVFERPQSVPVSDISEVNLSALLCETYTITTLHTERRNAEGNAVTFNLLPKAVLSLKVVAELPIIVVLMYQLYKQNVHQDVAEFIPLIMVTITLQPSQQIRSAPNFNREILVDFMAAQIKTLSFLAYIIKIYQDPVSQHSVSLVRGVLGLLMLCPPEVAHLRKEILIAARYILQTDLRLKFVPYMEKLLDETVLLGVGWTANESCRTLAYTTLADLIHHVRQHLPLNHLTTAVHLFSKNVHDESQPTTIQTMSCKLLLNLVDCIRTRTEMENGDRHALLMRMLEVFVQKFKTIAQTQIPALIAKSGSAEGGAGSSATSPSADGDGSAAGTDTPTADAAAATAELSAAELMAELAAISERPPAPARIGLTTSPATTYSVVDCRNLVKTLICGVKTITWGCASCKVGGDAVSAQKPQSRQFSPAETLVFIRLVHWALLALDIYTLNGQPAAAGRQTLPPPGRSREEKEVLEHFAGVFAMMHPATFQEIFSTTIGYMVDRINKNSALQIVANSFLANAPTSPIFATILVEYLLNRMAEMGSNQERSSLYLKLFKLIFGSVTILPHDNEQMLKPYLHQIVNKSMELAMTAREPYNYFLLLRALFRSIGGGSHDLLYQEFLPLLPNLLQGLNSLQSGLHKQHMKDLFVELCLTVPVRLSSLLPYLPMLMDPLVSALNGSQTLVSQGLRTLELCVDNLQPDFLYEHIQPVRAELMQALWRTIRNPTDQIAHNAFRVLGKFGGGNRRMMVEPQTLQYNERETPGPCVTIQFQETRQPVALPIDKAIETAYATLKSSTSDPYYRRQSWKLIRAFLVASISLDDDRDSMYKLLSHPSFHTGDVLPAHSALSRFPDAALRAVHQTALTAMFIAAAVRELRDEVTRTMICVVNHYTLVACVQQAGPFGASARQLKLQGMDPLVLVDALAYIMGHEEKELCKPGRVAIQVMLGTATTVMGSLERACQLPLMENLSERLYGLCYERAWYSKLGGCEAIGALTSFMAPRWLLERQYVFVRALLFVMTDLSGEVSSGAVDKARQNMDRLLTTCAVPAADQPADSAELAAVRAKSQHDVTNELVRQLTSPNSTAREQAMHSLELLAGLLGRSTSELIGPHKETLADMVPPKKHLVRQQPANAQIGIMDGNTFCYSLQPRLFTIDLNISEHKVFFSELFSLCEADDASLLKLPCYKSINLTSIRQSALRCLAECYYIPNYRDKIFSVLYNRALNSSNAELQECGFQCMQKFIAGAQPDMEVVHQEMRPLLLKLGDHRSLNLTVVPRLSYLTRLFPNTFKEKLCEQLVQHLRKWMETAIQNRNGQTAVAAAAAAGEDKEKTASLRTAPTATPEYQICTAILGIFPQIPAASSRFVELLIRLVLTTESQLCVDAGSTMRAPLLKFLARYPQETIDFLLTENVLKEAQNSRFLKYLIQHEDGQCFRDMVQASVDRLTTMVSGAVSVQTEKEKSELQYQAVHVVYLLTKHDDQWLAGQRRLVEAHQLVWCSDAYHEQHQRGERTEAGHWQQPRLLARILLRYFIHHPDNVHLLLQLVRALTSRYIVDFQFIKDFLEGTVAQSYTVAWKRDAFFKFVELYQDPTTSQQLKAKVLQYIIIPCFAVSFERGEVDQLIGQRPAPEDDSPENIVSVFIRVFIDTERPAPANDGVRILLLQLSCLLIEHASPHIHDADNKRQGNKLRRLMTFAWPCLMSKNCVDPTTKYHGHLLLSHIIAKFAIHKRIVLQVFHSLLKAHAMEARPVVRQALDILTPAMPVRMEDGNTMLTHWTKKIIVEEGHHSLTQLVHMLQLLVRHNKVYYPVRHQLLVHMVNSVQRLAFSTNGTPDQKKLAVDLAEVIIRWEIVRKEDEESLSKGGLLKPGITKESLRRIDKTHAETLINFLLKLACQVNEPSTTPGAPGEQLSRRCVHLLKLSMRPGVLPHGDLRITWVDKLLLSVDTAQPNYSNICTALDLLTYLLSMLKRDQILANFKHLQAGLSACMVSQNQKVVRAVHLLLTKLMSMFPTEPTGSAVSSKYDELEALYNHVSKVVFEGLVSFEKNTAATTSSLYGTLLVLKAAGHNNPCYVDRLISSFMRVLQRMARDHLTQGGESTPVAVELLILALDLVKNRVGVMGLDMRKSFIGAILVNLIDKTSEVKVLKAITKMVDEWVKNKSPIAINQGPSLREKSILLVKLMHCVEKRFTDDPEVQAQFLELVNYIYRDDTLKSTELTVKLEPAFLSGLRCTQPAIRAKFFEVFDTSMKRRLHERLLYVVCSQNWEHIGHHYWIRQCLELLLVTASSTAMQLSSASLQLPSLCSVIQLGEAAERQAFHQYRTARAAEPAADLDTTDSSNDELELAEQAEAARPGAPPAVPLQLIVARQAKFLEGGKEVRTSHFLAALVQLCHSDQPLAERIWLDFFPRVWKTLTERQQQSLSAELVPFLVSGAHNIQKDCSPSALNTFVEALVLCQPSVSLKPCVMRYLGKSHNLWYRMALSLEQMAMESGSLHLIRPKKEPADMYDFEPSSSNKEESLEILESLCELYKLLREEDLWIGLWQKMAKYSQTNIALAYEQQGFFEQAQGAYELTTSKMRADYATTPAPASLQQEMLLVEEQWIRCCKELNQWDLLLEYGRSSAAASSQLVLDSAWRVPSWTVMKDALQQVEVSCPKEMGWKVNLYRGYIAICHPDEPHLSNVEKLVDLATNQCMKEWRKLPSIVSHVHIPYLQAAQQIMELQEAAQIHQNLLHSRQNAVHDMKAIVKTWRNRLPVISDDLSHWSDVFTWRQHHYQFIVTHYSEHEQGANNQSMLGVHASAQAIIHYGKMGRKHGLLGVCLESLNRIHTIPSVPIVDCFQKIRQQVKCYHQSAAGQSMSKTELQEGLEVIEHTNMKYFTKEMISEFYALKGMFLSLVGRSEDANKAFSAAVQMDDTQMKAWALWGEFMEAAFIRDPSSMATGVSAITCFLHACRHQKENKSRKYLSKVLWLLTYNDEANTLAEAVEHYCAGVPPMHWLPWIPQLLTCLVRNEGKPIMNLLTQVGRTFPQAVYFPIRTLYLTLKIEQRERHKTSGQGGSAAAASAGSASADTASVAGADSVSGSSGPGGAQSAAGGDSGSIRATAPMWRCSRIMHNQRDVHPTVLSSLEGIVDQMVWFRENWYEEVLRQLRQALTKCLALAFDHRAAVTEAPITPHTLNFVKKLVATFGIGVENVSSSVSSCRDASASEFARRVQATVQDPVFQRMKGQFTSDFDFTQPGAMRLHNLIQKLKKWIKILEVKIRHLPKQFLIEEKCRWLSNFSAQTAEIEIPGEFLQLKHSHYYVRIARFMPRVEIVQKHGTAARRLFIRGNNGKLYPYLVVNDTGLSDARREERVLQLLRIINHYLAKMKETSRRFLSYTVPRVVAVSPHMRLIEDNPSSMALLDIYKQRCTHKGIEHDAPISRYYDRLASIQSQGGSTSHRVLRENLRDVQSTMVPRTLLRDWAAFTYPSATAYWMLRKTLTLQLALLGLAEYVLHLTRLAPEMMYIHQDSGLVAVSYFKFELDDAAGELVSNRPVPFRLTPNLAELVTQVGVMGPLTAAMVAAARCLSQPNYKLSAILRAVLRDELIAWHRKRQEAAEPDISGQQIIQLVTKAVSVISSRLNSLATFEGTESKASTLVAAAASNDNLCRMNPVWHPWL
ncbi:Transformation/transcription domain-associated protein [Amphibalanus amphitrite]|uniref:Transformation/transcription domain-associated protein n=1 Tax=Amphibalanus amphitrite TaxID=1232801 RepID=A0A6A4VDK5_AMPAM|nr:Transformation/transcription domain-associated protein [Amphibalanus amphitrite]